MRTLFVSLVTFATLCTTARGDAPASVAMDREVRACAGGAGGACRRLGTQLAHRHAEVGDSAVERRFAERLGAAAAQLVQGRSGSRLLDGALDACRGGDEVTCRRLADLLANLCAGDDAVLAASPELPLAQAIAARMLTLTASSEPLARAE